MKKVNKNGLTEQEIGRLASAALNTSITSSAKADGIFSVLARNLQDQTDEGIDFQIELLNRKTRRSVITFSLQSKGVEKQIKINKKGEGKGKISFPLEIKHVNYYRRYKPEAVVIVLVDISTNIVYWHPIQLDNNVERAVENVLKKKPNQKHVTIYFDPSKQINKLNFSAFVQDMHLSTAAQSYRYNTNPPSELVPQPLPKTGRPLDDIYAHFEEQFKYLNYIPLSLMSNSYPFKINKESLPMMGPFHLLTDNIDLYELFDAVKRVDQFNVEITDKLAYSGVENSLKKISSIMRWLTNNHVYFISLIPKLKKKGYKDLLLHHTASEGKLLVLYRRLNLNKLIKLLKSSSYNNSTMEEAYVHFHLGNTNTAQKIFKVIAQESSVGSIHQYIAYFNRKECLAHFNRDYHKISEYETIKREIKEVPLEITYRQCINQRQKSAIGWIHNNNFITDYQFKISNLVAEIKDKYYNHLKGGWSENNLLFRLQAEYGSFEGFITENLLLIDQYKVFKELTMLFIEGLVAGYAIRPGFGDRLDAFDDWILEKIMLHADAEKLRNVIRKYGIKNIQYRRTGIDNDSITDLINNFLNSVDELPSLHTNLSDGEHGRFWDFFNRRLSTMLVITAMIELDKSYILALAKKMIFLLNVEFIWPMQSRHFSFFFRKKAEYLDSDIFKELLFTIITNKNWEPDDFIFILTHLSNTKGLSLILTSSEMDLLTQFFFNDTNKAFEYHKRMELAGYTADFLDTSSGQKLQWITKIKDSLKIEFSECAFWHLAISDHITFDKDLMDRFKNAALQRSANDDKSNKNFTEKTGQAPGNPDDEFMGEQRIYLDQLIQLLFKYKGHYRLSDEESKSIATINSYYQWLLNLEKFDYSQFHPGWITRFGCSDYYKEFRKHPSIRTALEYYLQDNVDQVALSAYFALYAECKKG